MMLARFDNLRLARAFSDYLRKQRLEHRLVKGEGVVELWVDDETNLDAVRRELARFRENPTDARYLQASWEAPPPAEDIEELAAQGRDPGWLLRTLRSRGPVTLLVLLACIAVAIYTSLGESVANRQFFSTAGLAGAGFYYPDRPWQLLTPALLHFGIVHLAFNLCWWWMLAGLIEEYQSSFQLLMLTLGLAAVTSAAEYWFHASGGGGLSGVIYGLCGYLWLYGRTNPAAGYQLSQAIVGFMVVWMLLGFTGLLGPMGNAAHLSGLIAGSVIGVVFGLYRRHVYYRD